MLQKGTNWLQVELCTNNTCSTAIFKPSSPLLQLLISLGVHLSWQYNLSRLTQLFKWEVFYICLVTLNFSFIFRKTARVLTRYCPKKTNTKCIMSSPWTHKLLIHLYAVWSWKSWVRKQQEVWKLHANIFGWLFGIFLNFKLKKLPLLIMHSQYLCPGLRREKNICGIQLAQVSTQWP